MCSVSGVLAMDCLIKKGEERYEAHGHAFEKLDRRCCCVCVCVGKVCVGGVLVGGEQTQP